MHTAACASQTLNPSFRSTRRGRAPLVHGEVLRRDGLATAALFLRSGVQTRVRKEGETAAGGAHRSYMERFCGAAASPLQDFFYVLGCKQGCGRREKQRRGARTAHTWRGSAARRPRHCRTFPAFWGANKGAEGGRNSGGGRAPLIHGEVLRRDGLAVVGARVASHERVEAVVALAQVERHDVRHEQHRQHQARLRRTMNSRSEGCVHTDHDSAGPAS